MNTATNVIVLDAETQREILARKKEAEQHQLLTMAQVGSRLQCSRTSVWRAVNEGGLRSIKFGALRRVRVSDLENWLAKHADGGAASGGEQ